MVDVLKIAKMSWMIAWRLIILAGFFTLSSRNVMLEGYGLLTIIIVSVATSLVLYSRFRVELRIFPLFRLMTLNSIFKPRGGEVHTKLMPENTITVDDIRSTFIPPFAIPRPMRKVASKMGTITGFENNVMQHVPIPTSNKMFGSPGAGLNEAVDKFGDVSVKMGQRGEENFAKILGQINFNGRTLDPRVDTNFDTMLDEVYSFWSVSLPHIEGQKDYNTDVDCVLVKGNRMLLVDLKYYSDGDVIYYATDNFLYTIDRETSEWVGKPKKMSKNMEMALDRFRDAFPDYIVSAIVIMVPTQMGEGTIGKEPYAPVYEGGIKLHTLTSGLMFIAGYFNPVTYMTEIDKKDKDRLTSLLRTGKKVY